ncbi:hypothetical protein [Aeromonas jandaei]|uniref:hypothetical protein n=1 Tax=Aeromonas jandaei TaxID=650 RepID=UPI002B0609C5|nr:hypothetical protein [Aeromonas jandaei]
MENKVLLKVSGENICQQRELSQEDLLHLKQAQHEIIEFNKEYQLLDYVNENYNSFMREIINMVNEHHNSGHVLTPFIYDEFIRFINRSLLNLLTSMRTMTDHLEAKVKRVYGADSQEFLTLKRLFSNAFDTHFHYGFSCKLRNFVQHVGMPPFSFSMGSAIGDANIKYNIKLDFERDELLMKYDSWGPVKKRLMAQDERFSVFEIIEDLVDTLFDIYAIFKAETSLKKVQDARDYILNFIGEPKGYALHEYGIGQFTPDGDKRMSIQLTWLPTALFDKLTLVERHL